MELFNELTWLRQEWAVVDLIFRTMTPGSGRIGMINRFYGKVRFLYKSLNYLFRGLVQNTY